MIADKIKNARTIKKLTQEQVAEDLNVSRQTISNWENGVSHSSRYHTKYDEPTLIHYQL